MSWLREGEGAIDLQLLVQPRASRSRVVGEHGDRLKVQVAAPPVDGAANEALIALFAELLRIPRRQLELTSGEGHRRKQLRIRGLSAQEVRAALSA